MKVGAAINANIGLFLLGSRLHLPINREAVASQSPGLPRKRLPWGNRSRYHATPKGLRPQPFQGWKSMPSFSQRSRCRGNVGLCVATALRLLPINLAQHDIQRADDCDYISYQMANTHLL